MFFNHNLLVLLYPFSCLYFERIRLSGIEKIHFSTTNSWINVKIMLKQKTYQKREAVHFERLLN